MDRFSGVPARFADPIAPYDHVDGVGLPETRAAIIGGFVSRGAQFPALRGHCVFGDYAADTGLAAAGHLFVLGANQPVTERIAANCNPLALAVLGWVQDQRGEIYLLANGSGTLTGATGMVLKIESL